MIEVLEPGFLTSVQAAPGRIGLRHLGIAVGGAADAWSARLANRLVGNDDSAALLEITLAGPTLRFDDASLVALAGPGFESTLDGVALPPYVARRVRPGSPLRVGSGTGARSYLAVAGGLAVPPVLGSAATDLRSGFGGHQGRSLRSGDRLELRGSAATIGWRWTGRRPDGAIRILPGPHHEVRALEALSHGDWVVSAASDRSGVRIEGPRLTLARAEVPSMGLPPGAIQVPADGQPILLLADRPVTGGYPVPACVIGADVGRVAQLRPGDAVAFASVSMEEAIAALREAEEELGALEPADASADDELGWAGALE